MFGFWESILSFLIRQVGLRTDAANAAGSLHAKIKDAKDNGITVTNSMIGTSADERAANTVMGWLATGVKSIQRGITTYNVSSGAQNITIATVNLSKSFITFNQNITDDFVYSTLRAQLTSTTNLELYRNSGSGTVLVSWEVIEFY